MPTIIQYDRNLKEIRRDEASKAPGVAYGVKEDAENGFRGLRANWCTTAIPKCVWLVVID